MTLAARVHVQGGGPSFPCIDPLHLCLKLLSHFHAPRAESCRSYRCQKRKVTNRATLNSQVVVGQVDVCRINSPWRFVKCLKSSTLALRSLLTNEMDKLIAHRWRAKFHFTFFNYACEGHRGGHHVVAAFPLLGSTPFILRRLYQIFIYAFW